MNEAIFILNGVNITADTEGVETLRERIYYDEDLRGYLREIGGELKLNGDAYRFVQDRFKFDFDNPIPCSLSVFNPHTEIIESVFNGVIFPADCEFDLYAKKVTCQLVDTTFFAKIDNNKNLKFTINAGLSKLGADISGRGGEIDYQMVSRLWSVNAIQLGNPSFPAFGIITKAITLFQALDYLVAAMTDGDVAFFSTFLTDSATDPNYCILSGEQVRMADPLTARRPYVSWAELFGDLSRQFSLLMAVEEFEPNRFRIRVEPYEFWKQQQVTDLFEVKPRVKERVDIAMLPSSVLVGSAKVEKKLPIPSADMFNKFPGIAGAFIWVPTVSVFYFDFLPQSPFIYHWQEEYNYQYQSNVDSPQLLRHSVLITDTKLYQYQVSQYWARFVVTGYDTEGDVDESYDEDVFLIRSTEELTAYSITVRRPVVYQEPFFSIINRDINNVNTMLQNLAVVPASANLLYSSLGSQRFRAFYTPSGSWPTFTTANGIYHLVAISYLSGATNLTEGDFIGNTTYEGTQLNVTNLAGVSIPAASNFSVINGYVAVVAGFNQTTAPGFDNTVAPGWDNSNFYWTVGVTALYSFRVFMRYVIRAVTGAPATNQLAQWFGLIVSWDSTGTNLKEFRMFGNGAITGFAQSGLTGNSAINSIEGVLDYTTQQPLNLQSGDKVQVIIVSTAPNNDGRWGLWLTDDSFFEIQGNSLPDTGGAIITNEVGSTDLIENELEADIPFNIWNKIKANPFAKFLYQVADDGEARVGYLKDFDREIISGRFNGITKIRAISPTEGNRGLLVEPIEEEIPEPDEPE